MHRKIETAHTVAQMFVFFCVRHYISLLFIILSFLFSPADDSGDDCPAVPPTPGQGGGRNSEVQSTLRTLNSKVEDLTTCNDLIVKHGSALQRYQLSG